MALDLAKENLKGILGNWYLAGREPWQIVSATATAVLGGVWLWGFLFQEESLVSRGKRVAFRLARHIPAVARRVDSELRKINKDFEEEVIHRNEGNPYIVSLPKQGKTHQEIVDMVKLYLGFGDYRWQDGYVSGAVYYFDEGLIRLLTDVYGLASYTNPLHPDIFPGVCKMEAEVVRMTAELFHGGPASCGTMTTGGTESILMACKAYRDYAREEWGIKHPEIVLPTTAHPAFDKAGLYFGIRITHVPVDPETYKVDVGAMRRAVSRNTILLVGSTPNFPYGTMDDIEAVAALGLRKRIPVHVDACLGGFVIAFMRRAGYSVPPFDFAVPGVTSISADTHKYGFAPKGSSVILYSEPKYRHHQFCVTTDWPGGVYGSPTVNGSRAGGIIAACWATMISFGLEGYVDTTKKIVETTRYIVKRCLSNYGDLRLSEMDSLFVFGEPATSVIAIGSRAFHIYRLSDALGKRGWNLNPLQYPPGIHLCVTYMHTMPGVADRFVADVRAELGTIMQDPRREVDGKLAMYGMSQGIPDRSIVGDFTRFFLDSMYYTPAGRGDGPA